MKLYPKWRKRQHDMPTIEPADTILYDALFGKPGLLILHTGGKSPLLQSKLLTALGAEDTPPASTLTEQSMAGNRIVKTDAGPGLTFDHQTVRHVDGNEFANTGRLGIAAWTEPHPASSATTSNPAPNAELPNNFRLAICYSCFNCTRYCWSKLRAIKQEKHSKHVIKLESYQASGIPA